MGEPRRIFISHNSAHNAESRVFLDELIGALRVENFEVLVDRDLEKGERWRGPLYSWMLLCDAAVLLIDKNTPDTTWLPREAMIFRWRKELDKNFDLFPVLRGVKKTILFEPPFKEMGLEDLGFIADDGIAPIVDALKKKVLTTVDRRLSELQRFLNLSPRRPQDFDEARQILDLGPNLGLFQACEASHRVAVGLFGLGLRAGPFPPSDFDSPSARALRSLALGKEAERKIVQLLSSYFIAREVGADLYGAVHLNKVIAIKVNLEDVDDWPDFFVRAHFEEAFSQAVGYKSRVNRLSPVTVSNGMERELVCIREAIYDAIWATYRPDRVRSTGPEDQRLLKKKCEPRKDRPEDFLWVREADNFTLEHLTEVQAEMQSLRLVYLWTRERPEHDKVYCLQFEFGQEDEEVVRDETTEVRRILGMEQNEHQTF